LEELKKLRAEPAFSSAELLVFGPVEAPVYRVDNRYRQRIVIKCRLSFSRFFFAFQAVFPSKSSTSAST
jgi:primosomal protein N'